MTYSYDSKFYHNILFDMMNKRLNLDNVLDILFDLAISCQIRCDIYTIFEIILDIEDVNLAQDYLQIIYNGTYKFYDYFTKLDKYQIQNYQTINRYINNLIKDEDEILMINDRLKNKYYIAIYYNKIIIDCNMKIFL